MRVIGVLTIAALLAVPALADDNVQVAQNLGTILAAEQYCGLQYDQAAVRRFIESKVSADDLAFPGLLTTMTGGATFEQEQLSASGKTAHCTQIARLAKTYGLVAQ